MNKIANPLPKMEVHAELWREQEPATGLPGVVLAEKKRCGKANCRCTSGEDADLHGPYFYRYWREQGRLRKAYVPQGKVESTREACQRRQERERAERIRRAEFKATLRSFRERAREVERTLAALKELKRHVMP